MSFIKKTAVYSGVVLCGALLMLLAVNVNPVFFLNKKTFASVRSNEIQAKDRKKIFKELIKKQLEVKKHFDELFVSSNFAQAMPYEEMRKMREELSQSIDDFDEQNEFLLNPFDFLYANKFGYSAVIDVSTREDEDYVYYDININDLYSPSISTKIIGDYITITGTAQKEEESGASSADRSIASKSVYSGKFIQTLPIPVNTDKENLQIVNEKNKVTLMFPKNKSEIL